MGAPLAGAGSTALAGAHNVVVFSRGPDRVDFSVTPSTKNDREILFDLGTESLAEATQRAAGENFREFGSISTKNQRFSNIFGLQNEHPGLRERLPPPNPSNPSMRSREVKKTTLARGLMSPGRNKSQYKGRFLDYDIYKAFRWEAFLAFGENLWR